MMNNDWVTHNLQVIRTLMERTGVYRRALAPIMTVTGCLGVAGSAVPCFVTIQSNRGFSLFWMAVSLVAIATSFLLVRRQALREDEPFWSPPTRQVTRAMAPAFFGGLVSGCIWAGFSSEWPIATGYLAGIWLVCYGCALHAAGFFMVRGIRLFGWIFVMGGCTWLLLIGVKPELQTAEAGHYVMGGLFGVIQLAYGIYLYFTEKARQTS